MMKNGAGYMADSDSEDELPPGWEVKTAENGTVCYFNHQNNTTQWTHPRTGRAKRIVGELPFDWEKSLDKETNRAVFRNKKTNQTTYVDPRLAFATEETPPNVGVVRQRFDSSSTALQVLHGKDLNGRLAVITGCNCGIGFETARSLLLHGCEVVFACRNHVSTEEAINQIDNERPGIRSRCRFVGLNLASFRSVLKFLKEIKKSVRHIDYLILNAAVFGLPYTLTEDGIESTFQVCHLSHFYITNQLETLLDSTSRVIVVSSESHRFANLPADNLTRLHLSPSPEKYWNMIAYNNAKLCNVLFARKLSNRWRNRGISVFSLHPGNMVSSKLDRNWWVYRLLYAIVRPFTKSLQQAAATTVYCATSEELTGLNGFYFNNCYFCESSELSKNETLQNQLWTLSEQMIGEIFEKEYNGKDPMSLNF